MDLTTDAATAMAMAAAAVSVTAVATMVTTSAKPQPSRQPLHRRIVAGVDFTYNKHKSETAQI